MTVPRFLSNDEFAHVVRNAPLVSIDIVIKDPDEKVFLGFRLNEPAKGTYFVPGGVIRKHETIRAAFSRILNAEVGISKSLDDARFLGAFEHLYETNRFGDPHYGTHYVVLAYELKLMEKMTIKLDAQHSDIRWMRPTEILSAADVHPNTKAYFE